MKNNNLEVQEITLVVNGRKEMYSVSELEKKLERLEKLEKHFSKKQEIKTFELAEKPTDGKCFKVDLKEILENENLFSKKRDNPKEENTRKMIQKAICELKRNNIDSKVFYLLIPNKEWVFGGKNFLRIADQMEFVEKLGGQMSNWVTEPLVWAQRIINESWTEVCNSADTLKWYRSIIWENGRIRLVGGSTVRGLDFPATVVFSDDYFPSDKLEYTVPSIILKTLEYPN